MDNIEQLAANAETIGEFSRKYFSYLSKVLNSISENEINKLAEHFEIASELDPKLAGKCYSAISEIHFSNQEINKALEFIDIALKKTSGKK